MYAASSDVKLMHGKAIKDALNFREKDNQQISLTVKTSTI